MTLNLNEVRNTNAVDSFIRRVDNSNSVFPKNVQSYKETTEKRIIVKTVKTLIEDDEFINDLTNFMNGRYEFEGKTLTKEEVAKLLDYKTYMLPLYKKSARSRSGYEQDYHDGSRWEGDYNPRGAHYFNREYSLSAVIEEFVQVYPDKVRWDVQTISKEE